MLYKCATQQKLNSITKAGPIKKIVNCFHIPYLKKKLPRLFRGSYNILFSREIISAPGMTLPFPCEQ
jgi:hypothetical protein